MNGAAIDARFTLRRGPDFTLDVDLRLPGRGATALFGPSGAGKSTLLRAVAGLDRHPGGLLRVGGATWQDEAAGVFVPPHRRALGYVFQESSLLPHLDVRGNLEFGWRRTPAPERRVGRDQVIALLDLAPLLARRPSGLSGGERQRVAIGRALLASPRLLLLDEPLAALDAGRKAELLPYLERLHDELDVPLLYVSHAADEVMRLADHVVLLDAGRVLASEDIGALCARLDLPLALGEDAGVVIDATAVSYDAAYGLLTLHAGDAALRLVHRALPAGSRLRLRILARDVSLALAPQAATSALNQLPATVTALAPAAAGAHAVVRLDCGGMALLARITRYSQDRLAIAPGKRVWVQLKAAAVLANH